QALRPVADRYHGRLLSPEARQEVGHLVQEQLVSLKALDSVIRQDLPTGVVGLYPERAKIDQDLAGVPNHLAGAVGGALDVVLVQVNRHGLAVNRTLHENAGDIFNVDLEAAEVPPQAEDTPRQTEERIQVVELMNLGQDYATAQVIPRGVHLP